MAGIASAGDEGIEVGRLKVAPAVNVATTSTDNFFTTERDKKSELITTLSPDLSLSFALAPESVLNLDYHGDFNFYQEYSELNNNSHTFDGAWNLSQPQGSKFKLDAEYKACVIRPYSENDREKDYHTAKAGFDSEVRAGSVTGLEFGYEFVRRRFDETVDARDDFDRHSGRLGLIYDRFALTSLVGRYSYDVQDNNDPPGPSTDMQTHTILAGFQRKPTARLSGDFMAGYTWTEVEDFEGFSGLAVQGNLTYYLSGLTQLRFAMSRQVIKSTIAERETNVYYVSTGGSVNLTLRRWENFEVGSSLLLQTNTFKGSAEVEGNRTDDLFGAVLRGRYAVTTWVAISAEYRYRNNDSNLDTYSYDENSVILRLIFSI